MSENVEVWKQIDGFGGRYSVSNMGRVYSDPAKGNRGGLLSGSKNSDGYRMVFLCEGGTQTQIGVHRLVALLFVPGRTEDRDEVNHIDGNKENNSASNLEWVTHQENMIHAQKVLGKTSRGCMQPTRRVLSREQVLAIRKDKRPIFKIAEDYHVGHSTISRVKNNIGWFAKVT